jgi:uncharacterized protein involved in type VI secretion and phage assembly
MTRNYFLSPLLAKVKDNQDPDKLGRIKVTADNFGEEIESDWLPILNFFGGSEIGAFFLPEVDDQVMVCFMGESPEQGVVLGGVWGDNQKPPETGENSGSDLNQDGDNNMRFIKSRSGHMIIMDDKDGEEKLQLIASGGDTRFEYSAQDKLLNIETDQDLTIKADKKLTIEAEEAELKFTKSATIDADGIKIESSSKDMTLKSNQNVVVEGTTIKLN